MSEINPRPGSMRWRRRKFFLFPLFAIAAALLVGAVIMGLWNAILPEVLGVGELNYGQAVGLLVLCRLLFGGWRGGGGRGWRRGGPPPQMRDKWMRMSQEERLHFREEWQARCKKRKDPSGE